MKGIKNWYLKKIVLNGHYPGVEKGWFNKLSMLNHYISVVVFLNILFCLFFAFFVPYVSLMLLLFSVSFLIPFFMMKKQRFKEARFLVVFFTNFILFYQTFVLGVETGSYFFYFPFFASMFYLFFTSEIKGLVFNYFYSSAGLIFILYFSEHTGFIEKQPPYFYETLFYMNFVGALFASTVAVLLINLAAENNIKKYELKSKQIRVKNAQLKKSIQEKNVLLAEVHHRVKNNLAVISGMINLQAHLTKNTETQKVLQDSAGRITSMSLIHEKIYNHKDLTQVDMVKYIKDLCVEMHNSLVDERNAVYFHYQMDPFTLDIVQAVPCGLIVNELVTNCVKHAFVGMKEGNIHIKSSVTGKNVVLSVTDDGSGFDKNTIMKNKGSLGMVIIDSLIQQIDGTYDFNTDNGTRFVMSFNINNVNQID